MRLKSLEIKGFKSFADKTVLHFNDNITGVVGPNGCGKSNIVDAIRWVLGEQKASMLRSEKMENLIFNGTKKRKSASLAEVSLTFENTKNILPTDYTTVTISRHYFRNGDSEYRLNDVPCRLKDITNLFMDTGVGSDSYAIIELGMVDDILNDKDNSRRRLFEQAAGIEKYKKRKKETYNKLTATQTDLDRVEDLLFEIENNLKTLETQAKRTEKYYKLKEEYKELSIELAILLLSDQKEAYKRISGQLEKEQDNKLQVEASYATLEATIAQQKKEVIDKEQAVSRVQKALNEKTDMLRRMEGERDVLRETLRNGKERVTRLEKDIQQSTQQTEVLEQRIARQSVQLEEQAAVVTAQKESLDKQLKQVHDKDLAVRAVREQLDTEKQKLATAERQVYELEKKMAINQVKLDNLSKEVAQGSEAEKRGKEALDKLNQTLGDWDVQVKERESQLTKLRSREANLQADIANHEKLVDKIRGELEQENRQLDARRNEYNLTKDLLDNLEGYPESIKFLRKEVKHTRHAPLLSDVIACQDEYKGAVENYLESYLNYYVVNNWEEARDCINILSEGAKGRANFFILSELEDYKPQSAIRADGALSALDILEIEAKYLSLAAYLLDHVYFLENIDNPELMARARGDKDPVFLTKSGKFIRGRFSLSGGATGLFEGKKLGRQKTLEKLAKAIKKHEAKSLDISKQLNGMQKKLEELKAIGIKKEIEQAQGQLNEALREITSIQTSINHAQQSIGHASDKFHTTMEAIRDVEKDNRDMEQMLTVATTEKATVTEQVTALQQQFNQLSDAHTALRDQYNRDNLAWHQQDNLRKQVEQELSFNRQQLEQTQRTMANHGKELGQLSKQLAEASTRLEEVEGQLIAQYDEKESLAAQVLAAEQAYYDLRGQIEELEEQLRGIQQQKNQLDSLIDSLKDKLNDLKLDLTSMKERLSVEFNVNINDIINQAPANTLPLEELSERVDRVKQRIEKFGEINPMAIEAFREMKERYDFIQVQREDLLKAKENLLKTIEEIDTTAKAQFMESFLEVRSYFQQVFRSLFTEDDHCDLILTDPDDPLESKIDIIAKPKGKRPLTINQLSGGEKTLTATALLFSLYLIKPAPFCVFDEVDAPLDDANIDKFTRIIREFSQNSQFIIVTHNKQTMSTVDIIYGVTMLEEGVSRVVPVDFRSLQ